MDTWVDVVAQVGVPTGFLIGLCYVLYRVGIWIGTVVIVPLAQKHSEFLDTTIESVHSLREMVESIRGSLEHHHNGLKQVHLDTLETRQILVKTTQEEKVIAEKVIELLESIDAKTTKENAK